MDLAHICGLGRKNEDSDGNVGCFKAGHVKKTTHRANMRAQSCRPVVQCYWCEQCERVCPHEPKCVDPVLTPLLQQQMDNPVVKVEVTRQDGSVYTINFE